MNRKVHRAIFIPASVMIEFIANNSKPNCYVYIAIQSTNWCPYHDIDMQRCPPCVMIAARTLALVHI